MKWKIPKRYGKFKGYRIPKIKKWIKALKPSLEDIEDPRKGNGQGRRYPVSYVLELYLISCVAGYCDCTNTVEFLENEWDIIVRFVAHAYHLGIPSHDCFCDILAGVDQDQVEEVLKESYRLFAKTVEEDPILIETTAVTWINTEEGNHKTGWPYKYDKLQREVVIKKHTCMDGKASKGATDKKNNGNTPYTGGFYNALKKLYEDLKFIPNGKEKGEATVMRQALIAKNLLHTIITADALHSSVETMEAIVRSLGEFLFKIKEGSHRALFKIIKQAVEEARLQALNDRKRLEASKDRDEPIKTPNLDKYQEKIFTFGDKGRLTKTVIRAIPDDSNLCTEYSPYINQLIYLKSWTVELKTDKDGNTIEEVINDYECCLVASCFLEIDDIFNLIKEHWSIETSHFVLDTILKEDNSTAKKGNQIFNRAVFKRLAYNMLQMLGLCLEEASGKTTRNKIILLRSHPYLAAMMVSGFQEDFCLKVADVFEKRKEVYLASSQELDFHLINNVSI